MSAHLWQVLPWTTSLICSRLFQACADAAVPTWHAWALLDPSPRSGVQWQVLPVSLSALKWANAAVVPPYSAPHFPAGLLCETDPLSPPHWSCSGSWCGSGGPSHPRCSAGGGLVCWDLDSTGYLGTWSGWTPGTPVNTYYKLHGDPALDMFHNVQCKE